MDHNNSTIYAPNRERYQHLTFEDRCSIKIYRKLGYSLRSIASAINCSASTVLNELRRGTGVRNGNCGRFPEYSAKRGQRNYEINRTRCHKKHKINASSPFIKWVCKQVKQHKWSFDICVGYARLNELFPKSEIVCTKTLYNELRAGNLPISSFDVPEVLSRCKHPNICRKNKRIYGRSIDERPKEVLDRIVMGHWEIDTIIGRKKGKEAVVLTLVEKVSDFCLAIKIPHKDSKSVMTAFAILKEEYGEERFSEIFKTITADNGSEFERLSDLEALGTNVYFAHPYSSWERPQNERQNRILRRYIPKGVSINRYSVENILFFQDEMNAMPRRILGYCAPEDLFDNFLDQVYSVNKIQVI